MKVKKAVITVAGRGQRNLALQTLIDRDGTEKSVLTILIEEALGAGIEEVGLVMRPGDETALAEVAGDHAGRLHFIPQIEPLGYGHAIYCTHQFTADAPFLHLVGDHIYIRRSQESCAQHLVRIAVQEDSAVSAVQPTREHLLPYYGAIGGRRLSDKQNLYRIETVIEKPTPTVAEQRLIVPGLRAGHYLCFFGMHVLTPAIMSILAEMLADNDQPETVWLSTALDQLSKQEQVLALEKHDWRYDLGAKYGLMTAQLALALNGRDRDQVLTQLVEMLAAREIGMPV